MKPDRLLRLRAAAQLLHQRTDRAPAQVVGHLFAVQAQELRSALLAVRARSASARAEDVRAALTVERSLVVTWLCRGTLHLVGRADYPLLLALTAPAQLTTSRRRLGEEGFDPAAADHAVSAIEAVLAERGPLPRAAIVAALAERGIRAEGQAAPHLLRLAALRGIVVQGPVVDGAHAFALTRQWLGAVAEPVDRSAALAELAARYLQGHGPATDADLATWAGLPLRDARAGLAAITDRLDDLGEGFVDLRDRERDAPDPAPRLLPSFDPHLLGWRDRTLVVPPERARAVHPGGGVLRAVATVGGRAVGTWGLQGGTVRTQPFEELPAPIAAALATEAEDVRRFLAGW